MSYSQKNLAASSLPWHQLHSGILLLHRHPLCLDLTGPPWIERVVALSSPGFCTSRHPWGAGLVVPSLARSV